MMSEDGRHSPTDGSWAWPRSGQTALKRVMPPEPRIVGTGRDPPLRRRSCNCKRSNCLKLYCECFANGVHCDKERCNCITCHNNLANEHLRREAIDIILDRNPHAFRPKIVASSSSPNSTGTTRHNKGCHCKRSNCLKKYCECFQANVVCTDRCRCQDCKNYEGSEARDRLINVFTANAGLPGHESQSGPSSKRPRLEHASSSLPPATTAVATTHNQRGEMYNDKVAGARAQTTVEANSASLLNVMNTTVVDDLVMILVSAAAAAAASAPSPPPPPPQVVEPPPFLHPSGMPGPPIMMPHAGGLGGGGGLVGPADMLVGGGTDPFGTNGTGVMMSSQHTHTTVAADSQGSTGSEPLMDLGADDELGCNEAFTLQAEEDLGFDGLDEQEQQRNEDSVGVRQETAVMQHLSIGVRQLAELVSKHRMR